MAIQAPEWQRLMASVGPTAPGPDVPSSVLDGGQSDALWYCLYIIEGIFNYYDSR
jgi:hypothetical protein